MAIDKTKGVQWLLGGMENPVTAMLLPEPGILTEPTVIYTGYSVTGLTEALAEYDIIYNDGTGSTDIGLMYAVGNLTRRVMILSARMEQDPDNRWIIGGHVNNGISVRPDFIQNIQSFYAFNEDENGVQTLVTVPELGEGDTCGGFQVTLQPAEIAETPNVDTIILVTNEASIDTGVLITPPENGVFDLLGPEGGVAITEEGPVKICLSPLTQIPEESISPSTTACFEMNGLFAIEIDGVMVPYHFSESDLPLFFNATNPYGVQFIKCQEIIVCTPQDLRMSNNNILSRTFTNGEWSMDYQLNGGETRTYTVTLADEQWQLGVFRTMMQTILNQEDSGIQWVDSGGGIGHFQFYNWSLTAGTGDSGGPIGGEVDNSRSVKLIKNDNYPNDLFWFFFDIFDDLQNGAYEEAISCGFSEFPGY